MRQPSGKQATNYLLEYLMITTQRLSSLGVLLLLLILNVFSKNAIAQADLSLYMEDESTGAPVEFATFRIYNSSGSYSGITDTAGEAHLSVPAGHYTLEVLHLSYREYTDHNFVVKASGSVFSQTIKLKSSSNTIEGVEITANNNGLDVRNPYSTTSARHIDVDQIDNSAGTFKDVARTAQTVAGVTGGNNQEKNEIIIRGNTSRGMAWFVEDIPVPSPNHFSEEGASKGAVSMVSSNNLAGADLYTGAFPAMYGNAISGVFDIHMRQGITDKRKIGFEISPIGLDFRSEGPMGKGDKSSYLVNYRFSTLTLMGRMGIDLKGLEDPTYQDLNYKFAFRPTSRTTVEVFGVNGYSTLTQENYAKDGGKQIVVEKASDGYAMLLNGVAVTHQLTENLTYKSVLAHNYSFVEASKYVPADSVTTADEFKIKRQQNLHYHFIKTHNYLRLTQPRWSIQTGMHTSYQRYRLNLRDDFDDDDKFLKQLSERGNSFSLNAYVVSKVTLGSKWVMTGGANMLYHHISKKFVLEPRLGMKYIINDKSELAYGFGLHSKFESPLTYLTEINADSAFVQPNRYLAPTRAVHNVLSYVLRIKQQTIITIDLYHQYLFHVPVLANKENSYSTINIRDAVIKDKLENTGTGRNFGIEFTINQYLPKRSFIAFNASAFDSRYRGSDGQLYNTRFNVQFVSNLMGGKEFLVGKTKKNSLRMGSRVCVIGGTRYTPLDEERSAIKGRPIEDRDREFEARAPLNYRIDLSFSYILHKPKYRLRFKFDIQNVTNRENTVGIEYDSKYGLVYEKQGQIIPVFFLEWQF